MSNKKTIKRAMALALASTTLFAGALSAHAEELTYDTGGLITGSENSNVQTIDKIAEYVTGNTVILSTNDTHGAVQTFAYAAGLKNYFSSALGASDVILVDSGDFGENKSEKDGIPGPLEKNKVVPPADKGVNHYNKDNRSSITKIMKAAGYDYITWGNHEFANNGSYINAYLAGAEAEDVKGNLQIINSNVMNGDHYAFTGPVIHDKNGLKIGFFGLDTTEIKRSTGNYKFKDITDAAKDDVTILKDKGANIIICLSHLGLQDEYSPIKIDSENTEITGEDFSTKYNNKKFDYILSDIQIT